MRSWVIFGKRRKIHHFRSNILDFLMPLGIKQWFYRSTYFVGKCFSTKICFFHYRFVLNDLVYASRVPENTVEQQGRPAEQRRAHYGTTKCRYKMGNIFVWDAIIRAYTAPASWIHCVAWATNQKSKNVNFGNQYFRFFNFQKLQRWGRLTKNSNSWDTASANEWIQVARSRQRSLPVFLLLRSVLY